MSRQICATPVCPAIARRTVLRERYCEACAPAVELAAYFATLSPEAAEARRYRDAFKPEKPKRPEI